MSKISGHFFLNSSFKHYKIKDMKFNRITINTISIFITIIIITIVYLIPKFIIETKMKQNTDIEKSEKESRINESEISDWQIKVPELMLNKSIVNGYKENQIEGNIIHYDKSYIKNGTIILFCKEKIDKMKINVSVFYKVNEDVFEYKTKEKNFIEKEGLEILVRRRK